MLMTVGMHVALVQLADVAHRSFQASRGRLAQQTCSEAACAGALHMSNRKARTWRSPQQGLAHRIRHSSTAARWLQPAAAPQGRAHPLPARGM
eukprot:CAMPEP_0183332940 /NCGR_PEP_ID=MMETSP0164_2-20130417/1990_1 /TAXON_ID=221442 /ORGANISM="Coccolithus pelagicus ssp braarudi, Strain PLY182g" /LENGTH=92 /DNA_ID=CAMNT_0025501759 /DNA_START=531 /DNA_END=810 /DNA_ORIENTATION=-